MEDQNQKQQTKQITSKKGNTHSRNGKSSGSREKRTSQVERVSMNTEPVKEGQIQTHSMLSRISIDTPITANNHHVYAYAVANFKLDIQDVFTQVWPSATLLKNRLDVIANKYAKAYFTSVSPATIDSIVDNIKTVLDRSARAYSIACTAVRSFNCYNSKDMYGRSISFLVSNYEDYSDLGDPNHILYVGGWDFTHNNEIQLNNYTVSKMKKDFIGPCSGLLFLSPTLKETLRALFTGTIKESDVDSDVARYITFYPEYSQNEVDLDHMKTELDSLCSEIRTAIGKYPFLTNILEEVGLQLVQAPDFYDIDQTQNSIVVFTDTNNVIKDAVDHFSRSDYAVTDNADINDIQFGVEVNSVLKDKLVGVGANLPLFQNINYSTFLVMMMGNINPLNMVVARILNESNGNLQYHLFGMSPMRIANGTALSADDANRIIAAEAIKSVCRVVDLDESWVVNGDGDGVHISEIAYDWSLASYIIPREYNSLVREVSFAAFFAPRLGEVKADTTKQDIMK